jgi:hypothetical protein
MVSSFPLKRRRAYEFRRILLIPMSNFKVDVQICRIRVFVFFSIGLFFTVIVSSMTMIPLVIRPVV